MKTVVFCKCGNAVEMIYMNKYASPAILATTAKREASGQFVCRQVKELNGSHIDYCECDGIQHKEDKKNKSESI